MNDTSPMRRGVPPDREPVDYAREARSADDLDPGGVAIRRGPNGCRGHASPGPTSPVLPGIGSLLLPGSCRGARAEAGAARRRPVECGDMPFVIKRDGTWLYRGSPITRKELVCLFSSVLKREADGSYWLETPAERGRIEVEDAPFVAVELDWCGCGRQQKLTFRTNIDQLVTAGPEHPIRVAHDVLTCEPTPYIKLRDGSGVGCVEARIGRAVYYELVALAEPCVMGGHRRLGVWSCGVFFSLGDLPAGED